MQLVQRHLIKRGHKYWDECDKLCFASKNLYNAANFIYRQNFFAGNATNAIEVYHQLKNRDDYKALPAKVAQGTLRLLLRNWTSYHGARKSYQQNPSSFKAQPRIPNYRGSIDKKREDGRYVVSYNSQAFSKKLLKKGIINPSGTKIFQTTELKEIDEIRILPKKGYYIIELIYPGGKEADKLPVDRVAAMDLGVNNLATVTYNVPGLQPVIYDGRALKSINQYANKKNADLHSRLPSGQINSLRLERLWMKRNNKVDFYLHNTSRAIINELVSKNIGVLVIGWNENFKDSPNLGRVNNQKFVSIPHKRLIEQLEYKGLMAGIEVVLIEEAYTSLCSYLDNEPIGKHEKYLGKRVKRGSFRTADNFLINSDVNASLNIGRLYREKVAGNTKVHPVEGVLVHPVRVKPYKANF
ncbi:MAG: IS607 family transposase ISTvo1 [Chroococcopsis gigantea SAG 12.99]|jgi:putative transposase|nr:IS607 family transposase ISTvo1 [Chroococcopsis gigantea SAG 12.99]